jgi:hypothetical protein
MAAIESRRCLMLTKNRAEMPVRSRGYVHEIRELEQGTGVLDTNEKDGPKRIRN